MNKSLQQQNAHIFAAESLYEWLYTILNPIIWFLLTLALPS
jgi:hypothetical protein